MAILLGLVAAQSAAARGGSLDLGFGRKGWVVEHMNRLFFGPQSVVVQPTGRVVVATAQKIVRFRSNGQRDRSFAVRRAQVAELVQAPGGRLVRLGSDGIERMLPNGEPDPSFGAPGDGRMRIPGLEPNALAVDAAGRIVVVGSDPGAHTLAVARLLPGGTLDPGFGTGGVVDTAVSPPGTANRDVATSVALAADGDIVVGGSAGQAEDCSVLIHCWGPYLDAVVLRYLPDGRLDGSFGEGGIFRGSEAWGSARRVAVRPDGGVLFLPGGPTGAVEPGGGPGFAVVALTAAGQLDGSLAGDGSAQWFGALWDLRTSPYAGDLAVASDGRVLVGGGLTEGHRARILLAMRRADGGPARSFGRGGFLVSRTPPGLTGEGGATALAFGPHHRAYVAGRVGGDLVLARYLLG